MDLLLVAMVAEFSLGIVLAELICPAWKPREKQHVESFPALAGPRN